MCTMDLYDQENIISSDEYSEDDDDDEDLMNSAVSPRDRSKPSPIGGQPTASNTKIHSVPKTMQLSSLIRRNKIFIIYKSKAIKWLNNARRRGRYRQYLSSLKSKRASLSAAIPPTKQEHIIKVTAHTEKAFSKNPNHQNNLNSLPTQESSSSANTSVHSVDDASPTVTNEPNSEIAGKRRRSPDGNAPLEHCQKKSKNGTPQFYKKVNEMYPVFDEIAKSHIDSISNGNLAALEDKMDGIFKEIQILDEIILTKEKEWNRLIHMKMVKEELYFRLSRKHHELELKSSILNNRNDLAINQLEAHFAEKNKPTLDGPLTQSAIQKIIENRANMNTEDLQREVRSTSRLHSLLLSNNVLPNISGSQTDEGTNCNQANHTARADSLKSNIRGLGEETKKVKPLMPNVRSNNILNWGRNKHQAATTNINFDQQPKQCKRTYSYGLSSTPTNSSIKCPSNQDFKTLVNNRHSLDLDGLSNIRKEHGKPSFKTRQYPFCQECRAHEARFVCAGCGDQWYCSKKCQVAAWDNHSEVCTE